jgi:hypothetical protein
MSSPPALVHRPELDEFLFAAIGQERSGMVLTVVSALGRLGLDPWKQADLFCAMSKATAAQKLAPMIARLPDGLWDAAEVQAIATRLVALLPGAAPAAVAADGRKPRSIMSWLLGAALLAAVVLAMTSSREFSLGALFGSTSQASFGADDPKPSGR